MNKIRLFNRKKNSLKRYSSPDKTGKNEGESLALLRWALEMSLMALQYTLLPLSECKSREGGGGEGGMGLISFINVAIDRIRASRERGGEWSSERLEKE